MCVCRGAQIPEVSVSWTGQQLVVKAAMALLVQLAAQVVQSEQVDRVLAIQEVTAAQPRRGALVWRSVRWTLWAHERVCLLVLWLWLWAATLPRLARQERLLEDK